MQGQEKDRAIKPHLKLHEADIDVLFSAPF